jgi:hypothetical protein
MAITIQADTKSSIELDDFVDYVATSVDLLDEDSIMSSANVLKALSNNRRFIADRVNEELHAWDSFQETNLYTSPTIMLAQGNGFFVRANIWEPPRVDGVDTQFLTDQLFAYQIPHDHNFSFLTVGYLGSGYETTIYEYDYSSVQGMVGEHVPLKLLEKTRLPEGKMMFYRKNRDVHTQEHPEELSVSLNLMVSKSKKNTRQYFFKVDDQTISNTFSPRPDLQGLCSLAKAVGNAHTGDLLMCIANSGHCEDVRYAAYESAAALHEDSAVPIWKLAEKDPTPMIRTRARRRLEML